MTALDLDPPTSPGREALPGLASAHPGSLARVLATRRDLWAPQVRFDPAGPGSAVVWSDERHDAVLGTWLPGQASPVHRHLERPGALLVLRGRLEETTWVTATDGAEPGRQHAVRRHLGPDDGARSYGAVHVHGLRNAGLDPAIALHVLARV